MQNENGNPRRSVTPIEYDGVVDAIVSVQRNNEFLNSSRRLARRMREDPEMQAALQDLRAAEKRFTRRTAEIQIETNPQWGDGDD